jgi:flavin-dependent dehydrogenase
MGLVQKEILNPRGYVYYLRGNEATVLEGKHYIIGDAQGMATLDMGEGIGPAIQSGLLAAEAILDQSPFGLDTIQEYSLLPPWLRWILRK